MTPLTVMGATLHLVNDAEVKWLQDEMDSILAIAWLSGYRIDMRVLGKQDGSKGLRVFKLNFYHQKFDNNGLHRFTLDLIFNPQNTYRYSIFHSNDKEINKELPEYYMKINGKERSYQGTVDPRNFDGKFDMKISALEYIKKYLVDSRYSY